MTIFSVAPGKSLGLGGGKYLLYRPPGAVVIPPSGGTTPASIAGLAGWWDASSYAGVLNSSGVTASGWNTGVGGVTDKSGNTRTLVPFFGAGSGTAPQATARLNGILGGIGRNTVVPPGALPSTGQFLPVMDPDQGLRLPSQTFASGQPWTWMLVWSRPNWRQPSTGPVTLLSFGSVPVVQMDSSAGSGRLILFPGASQTIISGVTLTRRHTHSLVLAYTSGSGVNVWLDGTQVATGRTNGAGTGGVATILHDTTSGGGAQCWFHEAGWWTSALAGADITSLLAYLTRWTRGTRRGINLMVNGQSNAVNGYEDGAWHLMAQGIAWYLGALGWNVLGTPGNLLVGGEGLYQATGDPFSGSFLTDPNNGSNPSTWAVGQDGTTAQAYVTALAAAELADVAAIFWPWSESDSGKSYSEKATFYAAQQRYAALMRGWVGKTAAACPLLLWNPIPFQYFTPEPGNQMIREANYDLTQLSGMNAWIALPQTSDSISRSATGNADGTWTDAENDSIHRSAPDNVRFGQRGAIGAARAILASTGGDTISAIPAGAPAIGGPVISHVYQQSTTVYVVTVTHDAGTDLVVPLQAANGFGWSLMDGGSVASPGTLIAAVSCVYVSATKVKVTFPTPPSHAAASLLLFYPYGGMNLGANIGASAIGRGLPGTSNAVTDNFSTITPPAGWDIGNQLGSSWSVNLPLAATNYGVAVSTSP